MTANTSATRVWLDYLPTLPELETEWVMAATQLQSYEIAWLEIFFFFVGQNGVCISWPRNIITFGHWKAVANEFPCLFHVLINELCFSTPDCLAGWWSSYSGRYTHLTNYFTGQLFFFLLLMFTFRKLVGRSPIMCDYNGKSPEWGIITTAGND